MKKKQFFVLILFVLSIPVFGQSNSKEKISRSKSSVDNVELRINLLMSVFRSPELNYEYFLADNMGIGFALSGYFINETEDNPIKFTTLPYYRLYFGKKKCSGLFIEGNAAVLKLTENNSYSSSVIWNFGMGCAMGVKLFTKKNFVGEAYLGLGKVLTNNIKLTYPRVGITIGKRF